MTVTIVGAGLAGAACAVALREADVAVRVVDRGRAPGGRLASPELHGRRVDLAAAYLTVRDEEFRAVVERWAAVGLLRPWTDTFDVLTPGEAPRTTTDPLRWAAPGGLRSLVRELLTGIDVELGVAVDALPAGDVVLAMPDPQAARLVGVPEIVEYDPTIAVALGFRERRWTMANAAFVHDHPDVELVADDGARRGDGAAVLVAHSTAERARRHLEDPADALAPVVAGVRELLGIGEPAWTHVHRWTFAKPAAAHDATHGFAIAPDGRRIGLAGDQWCASGAPRVESAWRSGTELARALVAG